MRVLSSLSKVKITSLLVVLLFLSAAVLGARRWHTPLAKIEPQAVAASIALSQSPPRRENIIGGESVTLTPRGFEPAEITRPQGRFVLNINNRSGFHEPTFVLTDEAGNKLREVQFTKGKPSSRELLNLPPGRYRLSELSNADWVCQIAISGP
jgi:hypothetical protein